MPRVRKNKKFKIFLSFLRLFASLIRYVKYVYLRSTKELRRVYNIVEKLFIEKFWFFTFYFSYDMFQIFTLLQLPKPTCIIPKLMCSMVFSLVCTVITRWHIWGKIFRDWQMIYNRKRFITFAVFHKKQ